MTWDVVDLFSGAGGMSYGFHAHPGFRVTGAADAQLGKPSSAAGSLGCNASYELNMGITPVEANLAEADPADVIAAMRLPRPVTVLTACPPCTGFTRTVPGNHLRDDRRNTLVGRVADYARILEPEIIVLENARELFRGNFSGHLNDLTARLGGLGYWSRSAAVMLSRHGLPQRRERTIVIAVRDSGEGPPPAGLRQLWDGLALSAGAITVRRALGSLEGLAGDPLDVAPAMTPEVTERLAAVPHDGGSWASLPAGLMTPRMRSQAAAGRWGSHPDIYGRMWWDRPAPTIKRECSHVGNGRYAHPELDRLCTVREMAVLNGFPRDYRLAGSVSNMYRHIGDAVPPMISYQLAAACRWMLTGDRPRAAELIMPGCHLTAGDITEGSTS
jgi:DNA (cytosine-5)-methyltransferase 1